MAANDSISPAGVELLVQAALAGKPIAAQHSLESLQDTGLLKDHKYAYSPGVVRDGVLITSYNCPYMARENGKPADTPALVARFLEALSGR